MNLRCAKVQVLMIPCMQVRLHQDTDWCKQIYCSLLNIKINIDFLWAVTVQDTHSTSRLPSHHCAQFHIEHVYTGSLYARKDHYFSTCLDGGPSEPKQVGSSEVATSKVLIALKIFCWKVRAAHCENPGKMPQRFMLCSGKTPKSNFFFCLVTESNSAATVSDSKHWHLWSSELIECHDCSCGGSQRNTSHGRCYTWMAWEN